MVAAYLADKRYSITRYAGENNLVAFGIVPETRLPGERDRMFTIDADEWDSCVDACSLGGEKDPQYACVSLIRGIETRAWYRDIVDCVSEC